MATFIPSAAHAAARVAQVRRWLANPHLEVQALYDPIIRDVLANWRGRRVDLILDSTFLSHHKLQIVRLAVSHGNRAFPLTWQVLAQAGLVAFEQAADLLAYASQVVGCRQGMTLVADAGFRSCE